MNEWTVVTVIATLLTIGAAVIKPLISLNGSITRLTEIVESLEQSMGELAEKNSRSHEKLWERTKQQEQTLGRHDTRLAVLEADK